MGSLLPFYIVSCFLLPFSYMIKDVVEEKSEKIKGMKMIKFVLVTSSSDNLINLKNEKFTTSESHDYIFKLN